MIISDIDGTILPPGCTPDSPEVRDGVQELRDLIAQEKLQFTLASGRPFAMVHPLWNALGLSLPVICCNGAAAGLPEQGASAEALLWDERLSPLLIRPAVELADSLGMAIIVTDGKEESVYRENIYTKKHAEAEQKWETVYRPETEAQWRDYRLQKLLIIDPLSPGKVDEVIKKLQETGQRLSRSGTEEKHRLCEIVRYDDRGVEIMPANCTKEIGVRRLCGMLGMKLSDVLVCGDNRNDIGMFHEAGMSAAVGNAAESVKQAASYICQKKAVFGVLEAAEHFCKS